MLFLTWFFFFFSFYVDKIDFKTNLLFTGVCGYMEHISDQHKDSLNQEVILFLPLLPVLKDSMVGDKTPNCCDRTFEKLDRRNLGPQTSCRRLYNVSLNTPNTLSLAKAW